MSTHNGFINIDPLINNSVGELSIVGELSDISRTYALEKGIFHLDEYPGVELVVFENRGQLPGTKPTPPVYETTENALKLGHWVWQRALNHNTTSDIDMFKQNLLSEFGSIISNVVCTEMVTAKGYWFPSSVSWTLTANGDKFRLYFADAIFRGHFLPYDLAVIAPVPDVDDLINPIIAAKPYIEAMTVSKLMDKVRTVTLGEPTTCVRTMSYTWFDPYDPTKSMNTNWTVAVWGTAYNNEDIVREELISYILANSRYDRDMWEKVLPDLFTANEFIIAPYWDSYSIPNKTIEAGLYSPTVPVMSALPKIEQYTSQYGEDHLKSYVDYSVCLYKSLGFVIVGAPTNRDKIYSMREKFPDYACISTQHADFNRISPITQDWIKVLYELFKYAEDMGVFTDIPVGFSKITRNGVLYLSTTYESIQYLVVAKNQPVASEGE